MLYNSIIDDETGDSLEYRHLIKCDKHNKTWAKYFSNEVRRLTQGVRYRVKGTKTIFVLSHKTIPTDNRKDATDDMGSTRATDQL